MDTIEAILNGGVRIYTSLYNVLFLLLLIVLFICFVTLIGTGLSLLILSFKLIPIVLGLAMTIAGSIVFWLFQFLQEKVPTYA